ncbi:hypothetical protein [Micromonospora sp. NBC_00858]|uniref:hypothetical protein n=1 Tax=Micromonospora sp. NBC_00858 TaxID=2975979 RepID=UPI0038679628|nr:hypothetical protein OG990_15710 [Micromonospora sp. NBC_00858]
MPQIPIPRATKALFLSEVFFPSITTWNRLEGRPRGHDFDRSLRAEVRDPLWMICRQWQFGEFDGEDAGSAVEAKVQLATARVNRFAGLDGPAIAYDERLPLEAQVEREPIPLDLMTRAQLGRHWLKLIAALGDFKALYLGQYPFDDPPAGSEAEAHLRSDPQSWSTLHALQRRMPDGGKLYEAIKAVPDEHAAWLAAAVPDPDTRQALGDAGQRFVDWFRRTYSQSETGDPVTWSPGYLEYQFACSAPAAVAGERQTVLVAEQYAQGHLDWYAFDVDAQSVGLSDANGAEIPPAVVEVQPPLSFVPSPIVFGGMPAARWWEFEDRRTDLGDLKPSTTDLATLVLAEFGLVFGNDWSLVPYVLPIGTLSEVFGVVVKDVFGARTLVRAAGQPDGAERTRWGMYDLSLHREGRVLERLFLPPAVGKLQESAPLEKVILARDEMANMVWGVEQTIPALAGGGANGFEAAKALERHLVSLGLPHVEPPRLDTGALIQYKLGRGVPENWIPFIPVHNPGSSRDVRLQRAAMPRLIPGALEAPVEPRGSFLRPGLDETARRPYFVHEEEVPKAGVVLTRTYQRTRWSDGQVVTWLGRRKQVGLGQGSSGLAWDRIEPLTTTSTSAGDQTAPLH